MQNIYDILGSIGITVPEDKKADFDKAENDYLFEAEKQKPMSSYLGVQAD